jgi:NHL repeat
MSVGGAALVVAGVTALAASAATPPTSAHAARLSAPAVATRTAGVAQDSVFANGPGASTVVGTGSPGSSGDGGAARSSELDSPGGIAVDAAGDLFVADTGNCRVQEVPARSGVQFSIRMQQGSVYTIAGGPCGSVAGRTVGFVSSVASDASGDVFLAGAGRNEILELPAGARPGAIRSVAGDGVRGDSGDGGSARSAELDDPQGVAVDDEGDVYVADTANCVLREVASRSGAQWGIEMTGGDIYTIAGTGSCGQGGVGARALSAQLFDPVDVVVGDSGDLLVSDAGGSEILCLAATSGSYLGARTKAGDISVVAGTGMYTPYLVDGLPATGETAELDSPAQIAVDSEGDLFVADTYSSVVREVPARDTTVRDKAVSTGDMYTVAGAMDSGTGDQQTRWVEPEMLYPSGVAAGPGGALYYSDQGANVVRKISGA